MQKLYINIYNTTCFKCQRVYGSLFPKLPLADLLRFGDDLFFPVIVGSIQMIGIVSVLASERAYDHFVIDMKRDPVHVGKLLWERGSVLALDLFEMAASGSLHISLCLPGSISSGLSA